jgi:hypothetical protein
MSNNLKKQYRGKRWPTTPMVVAEICGFSKEHVSRIMNGKVKKDRNQVVRENYLFRQHVDQYIKTRKAEKQLEIERNRLG